MRIAIFADVHGNLPALEAILVDLESRGGADRVVDLGDCVSGPLWPRETMHRLARLDALTVRGNHDRQVATLDPSEMSASDRFAVDEMTPDQRARLGSLPATATVMPGVLAFHASPKRDDAYLVEEVQNGRLVRGAVRGIAARLGDVGSARVILCGHSHLPQLVRLPHGPLVLNPGSVGCPAYDDPSAPPHVSESGSPHARYAILQLHDGERPEKADVDFIAVSYDYERAAHRAEASGRPEWAFALRTGTMPRTSSLG